MRSAINRLQGEEKMNGQKLPKLLIISMLGMSMLLTTTRAEAWDWRHKYKHEHHRHNDFGKIVFKLPWDFITIVVDGRKYKYHDGHYYKKHSHGWKYVRAPRGACITRLPRGHKKVRIGKRHYYVHNGVYYISVSNGYEVVKDPTPGYSVTKRVKVYADHDDYDFETFTLKIPRKYGGYESIRLTRDGEGFVGPQGEYYDRFPRVAQLRVIYDL